MHTRLLPYKCAGAPVQGHSRTKRRLIVINRSVCRIGHMYSRAHIMQQA
jgi:hypothetical protein